ncbi:MAG TPA: zeta toxin family protein [Beijerinckiaceae bacterium]|nr:zeta toxin family protein [Beijerinckiaceae bacterium]
MPQFTLIAGSNGSGTSTLARHAAFDGTVVNADEIARALNPLAPTAATVAAGRETLTQLSDLIQARRDLVYKTTLSGKTVLRMLDRAKAAGYTIKAVFVAVPSADLAIGRVAERAAAGGVFVPPEVVRRRYERSFDTLPGLVARAHRTTIYDNTGKTRTVVARVEEGRLVSKQLDATNDLHVRLAQALKAAASGRPGPPPVSERREQTHEQALTPPATLRVVHPTPDDPGRPDASRAPREFLAVVNALAEATKALTASVQGAASEKAAAPQERTEAERKPTRPAPGDLLPPNRLNPTLPPAELSKRAAADPRLDRHRAAVKAAVERAFKEPEPIVAMLGQHVVETPGRVKALQDQLYDDPESLGELRGGKTFFRREDAERQQARRAAVSVAIALTDLAGAARSIKAEIEGEWSAYVQREQIAIPEPSEELKEVLGQGEMMAASMAAVARNARLVSEINAFLEAAHQRFGWAGMAAIRGGRITELRERLSGIREHDVERAATLTQDIAKLHDTVRDHKRLEQQLEVGPARRVGPKPEG